MRVLVTGAEGFIAKNLIVRLQEINVDVVKFSRESKQCDLSSYLENVDFIFHLAGVNRPKSPLEFDQGNYHLTEELCRIIKENKLNTPVLYTSSVQAEKANPYGISKLKAENALVKLSEDNNSPVYIYRLPNVFGKWSRPNYNSVVATFCYNVLHDIPLVVSDASKLISLVYIDDVIDDFFRLLFLKPAGIERPVIPVTYKVSVGELAKIIQYFKSEKSSNYIGAVGAGLMRCLYSTYLSFYQPIQFSYQLDENVDSRGKFVEILKTKEFGQISFFTAHPGVTRGGHYHHTKNEKFLVVKGTAKFQFRHVLTGQVYDLVTEEKTPVIVETVPGWSHDITNIGDSEMTVIIWANEVFDKNRPDTVSYKV